MSEKSDYLKIFGETGVRDIHWWESCQTLVPAGDGLDKVAKNVAISEVWAKLQVQRLGKNASYVYIYVLFIYLFIYRYMYEERVPRF